MSLQKGKEKTRVLVIGGGVVGTTCALRLLESGYQVTLLAQEFASSTAGATITTEVAGALWEWPPAVCGCRADEVPLEAPKIRCMGSFDRFTELAKMSAETGVYLRESLFFFKEKVKDIPNQWNKMQELSFLPGFRHDARLIKETGVNGVVDAYKHVAPMIDTRVYIQWLYKQCRDKKAHFVQDKIEGLLGPQADSLLQKYHAKLIVNCSGLGSKELAGDDQVYPVRGCILKVRNDGSLMPKLTHAMSVSMIEDIDGMEDAGTVIQYIIPRGEDKLWLGGMMQPNQWNRNLGLEYEPIRTMFDKLKAFYPPLHNYDDSDVEEVLVGLRPSRVGHVRLEVDPVYPSIVHNYGHGGSGVTFSWGCANEVTRLVEEILNKPPTAFASRL